MNTEELLKWYDEILNKFSNDVITNYADVFKELTDFVKALVTDRKLYQRRYELVKNELNYLKEKGGNKNV